MSTVVRRLTCGRWYAGRRRGRRRGARSAAAASSCQSKECGQLARLNKRTVGVCKNHVARQPAPPAAALHCTGGVPSSGALTVALARRRGLDVARLGELERARLVDGDAAEGRGVAAERGAEALRVGLHDAGELRAARGRRRRHVAADVVEARVQTDQRGRAPGLRRRRGHQRRRHGGRQEPRHARRSCSCCCCRRHFSPRLDR
jgi:hypothetical protein